MQIGLNLHYVDKETYLFGLIKQLNFNLWLDDHICKTT